MNPREYLAGLEFHGIKLGLDNIRFLAERAGDPQHRYPAVHVGGTNGKGSVVAMLDAILRAAGRRTGRYTSPHLMRVNERFLVDATPIPDAELDEEIEFFRGIAADMDHCPTYFEVVTAVAFRWFARRGVDIALFEVGMGGRFDATNIIHPVATAVTNIDLEHTRYLGDTLELIAFEKAGIFKEGAPAVIAETKPGPRETLLARAREVGAPVRLLGRDFNYVLSGPTFGERFSYDSAELSLRDVPLGLHGTCQGPNAAVAVALAERLMPRVEGLCAETVERGLREASWPCRLERVLEHPPVILDVAHNPAGMRELAAQLPPSVAILAVSGDKDAGRMLEHIAPAARELILTRFEGSRAMPLDQLCAAAGAHRRHRCETLEEAVALGIRLASDDLPLVITGSIFTAGAARTILTERYGAAPLRF